MNVGIIVNLNKPDAAVFTRELVDWLVANGFVPLVPAEIARRLRLKISGHSESQLVARAELVVALGGDGTLLRAARLVGTSGTPLLGINLGSLGFLTEFSTADARTALNDFRAGRCQIEDRMMLDVHLGRRRGRVLNDCSVNMSTEGRVIELTTRANGEFLTSFVGDGLVIATPTGSTAYSLAAGGPVVFPTMETLLLTPLCPHALGARPMVLPGDCSIELQLSPRASSAIVSLDGQERWRLDSGVRLKVSRSSCRTRLVTPSDRNFFQILRDKLRWTGSRQ